MLSVFGQCYLAEHLRIADRSGKSDLDKSRSSVAVAIVGAVHHIEFHGTHSPREGAGDRTPSVHGILHVRMNAISAQRARPRRSRLAHVPAQRFDQSNNEHQEQSGHRIVPPFFEVQLARYCEMVSDMSVGTSNLKAPWSP